MRKILVLSVLIFGGWVVFGACAPTKCRFPEAVLRTNLNTLREVIAQYHADKGRYPESLDVLIAEGYLRKVPIDPFTKSAKTWRLIHEDHPGPNGTRGIINVHSGAGGKALDGQPLAGL